MSTLQGPAPLTVTEATTTQGDPRDRRTRASLHGRSYGRDSSRFVGCSTSLGRSMNHRTGCKNIPRDWRHERPTPSVKGSTD